MRVGLPEVGPGRGFGFLVLGLGWVSFLLLLLFLFLFKLTQSNLFEFKIEFEFKLVEYCLEKKRGRKTKKGKKPKKPSPKPSFLGPTRDPFFPSHPAGPVLPSPSARSHSSCSAQAPRPSSPPFTARPSSFPFPLPTDGPILHGPLHCSAALHVARSPPSPRISPAPTSHSLLPLSHRPHLSALSSPPCRASVCWPGRASRRARALGHLRHVYSPAITAASSARGLRLLEPGTLETDRTGSVVRIRNHHDRMARTPRCLPAP